MWNFSKLSISYDILLAKIFVVFGLIQITFASQEIPVQRMSQFDLNGNLFGCRSSAISLEAKSLFTWGTQRHCVIAKFRDMSIDRLNAIRQKAGGLVLMLPENISSLSQDEKENLILLEQFLLSQPTSIPVYFSPHNPACAQIISDISPQQSKSYQIETNQRESAFSEMCNSISANGYQVVVSGASHVSNKNSRIPIIQGELTPKTAVNNDGNIKNMPTIVIVAHLNTFGLYNKYPLNPDSTILLTIAEQFSKLYNTKNASPKHRIVFLLSESGSLLNFQGVKKWLDENVHLQNVDFVLCLDTIIPALQIKNSNSIFMHVSKPPKEGTSLNKFYRILKDVAIQYNITIEGIHKKINLADQQLHWEHERFSMKRLPAFTLSALKTPKDPLRNTIFTDSEKELSSDLKTKAKIVLEALGHYVYNLDTVGEIFKGTLDLNVLSYMNLKSSAVNNDIRNGFDKHLKNVKFIFDKPDTRDPEFMFYEGKNANLNVYHVKPAVFDLFLTLLICIYLFSVYFVICGFPVIYKYICKLSIYHKSDQAFSLERNAKYKNN